MSQTVNKRKIKNYKNNPNNPTVMVVRQEKVKRKRNKKRNTDFAQLAPTSVGVVSGAKPPRFINKGQGCTVIHREYITDVTASSDAYQVNINQPVNPGNPSLFPWLSQFATRFESYNFKKLNFCYETAAATTNSGYVLLAVDYDPTDSAPVSKNVALNWQSTVKGAVWQCFKHTSTSLNLHKRKSYFVRTGNVPEGELGLFDTGNLFVCSGGSNDTNVGEIWAEYEIDFHTPQLTNMGVLSAYGAKATGGGTMTPANPFGTEAIIEGVPGSISLLTYSVDTNSKFTNPLLFPTQLMMVFDITGTSLSAIALSPSSGGSQVTIVTAIVNAAGTRLVSGHLVEFAGADATGNVKVSLTATTVTAAVCYIVPYGSFE